MSSSCGSSAGPSSYYNPDKASENFARLCQLILTICSDLLRDVFDRHIPPSDLKKKLSMERPKLDCTASIKGKRKKSPLNADQTNLLYSSGKPNITSKEFDISLLYILLRNICGITPHLAGWGSVPHAGDKCMSACIEKIRLHRNAISGHSTSASISDQDFANYWAEIKQNIVDIETIIGGNKYEIAINNLAVSDLNPTIRVKFADLMKKVKDKVETLENDLCTISESLSDKVETLEDDLCTMSESLSDQIEIKKERIEGIEDCQKTTENYIAVKKARMDDLEESEVSNAVLIFEEMESMKADIKGLKENENRYKEEINRLRNIIAKNIPEPSEDQSNPSEADQLSQVTSTPDMTPNIQNREDNTEEHHEFPAQLDQLLTMQMLNENYAPQHGQEELSPLFDPLISSLLDNYTHITQNQVTNPKDRNESLFANIQNMGSGENHLLKAFHVTVLSGNIKMCQYIIQKHPEILNEQDDKGRNAASIAAKGGNVQILEFLKENSANMKHTDNDKHNILHLACMSESLDMCQYIITHYPEMLHDESSFGMNVALCAALGGNVLILELLKDKKVNMKHTDNGKMNMLHLSCATAKLEMCRYIVSHFPDMLHDVDNKGLNAALCAAYGGNIQILELLEDKNVNMKHTNNDNMNILLIACASDRVEMCQYIVLNYPELLHDVDMHGRNAAYHAAERGSVQILELLRDNNVNMKHTNNEKSNILHAACFTAKLEMCRYIISQYPDLLHLVDIHGANAALNAAAGGNVQILELLRENEVNMKNTNNEKVNILHLACFIRKFEMCQYIISHYPDMIQDTDIKGQNASHYVAMGVSSKRDTIKSDNEIDIIDLLASSGIDLNKVTKSGDTILTLACQQNKTKLCKHLMTKYPALLQINGSGVWPPIVAAILSGNTELVEMIEKYS